MISRTPHSVARPSARVVRALLCLALVLGAESGASAQSAAPPSSADAREAETRRDALYREAVAAAFVNRWAEAEERFQAVLAIRPSPKAYFSLGQVQERLSRFASAEESYARALETARSAGDREVVAAAKHALSAIALRVSHLRVVVAPRGLAQSDAGPTAATATLDGRDIAVGAPVAVDAGTHRLVVSAPGMRAFSTVVEIAEGRQLDVSAPLEPSASSAPAAPASSTAPAAADPSAATGSSGEQTTGAIPWRAIGLGTAGAGVAALAVGTYFGLDARSKNEESNRTGCDGNECTAPAAQLRRDALRASDISTAAFVVGGVLTAGGVALWLLSPSPRGARVALLPVPLVGGSAVLLSGSAW